MGYIDVTEMEEAESTEFTGLLFKEETEREKGRH